MTGVFGSAIPNPEAIGMHRYEAQDTYLDHHQGWCWIGSKWDIAYDEANDFTYLYRKGNYLHAFRGEALSLALLVIANDIGWRYDNQDVTA